MYPVNCMLLMSHVFKFLRSFLCVKQKFVQWDSNPNLLIRSQTLYPLGNAAVYPVNCVCYLLSCQVLSLVMTRFLRSFLCVKQKIDDSWIRTPNFLIRSQTPYPLGHAAMCPVNCNCLVAKCCPVVLTRFLRCLLCVKQKVDDCGIRTLKFLIRSFIRWAMRPCVLSIVFVACSVAKCCPLCYSISKKFPLCQAKTRPQRDSNPQSSDSKSDAVSVWPCGHVSCQLYL